MGEVVRLSELSMERRGEWVDRLFARFSAMYGARFADMWSGGDLGLVKSVWADDLAGYGTDEVARGVEACRSLKFPPTLPEFLLLCRPPLDAESAFNEAVQQMALRDQGRDVWSHPAIYWSAVTIGAFDLRNATWSAIKPRWSRVLQAEMSKGEWPAVPPRLEALPAPGQIAANPEKVRAMVGRALNTVAEGGDKGWVLKIESCALAGEALPITVMEMASEVLGRKIERRAPAHRPDYADRIAGDDSFGQVAVDEEVVVL